MSDTPSRTEFLASAADIIAEASKILASKDCTAVRYYQIAGFEIKVTASSQRLLDGYLQSLKQAESTPSTADFEILLLEATDHQSRRPSSSTSVDRAKPLASSALLSEDDQAALILDDTNTLYAANLTKGIGVCWLGTDTQNEHYMPARPFRNLLHWFLTPRGYQLFHAGAIGGSNGAILLIGPSGCGKSTTCLNMLLDGFDYLGDDFVVVGPGRNTEGLAVFNVYNMARIRALPPILIENSDSVPATKQLDGKYRISLNPHFADRIKAELPLKGIVCPHLGSHSQGLVPVSASYGFRRALSTLGYLPGFEKLSLRHIGAYVSNVPCYSIELGNDYALTTQALAGLLSD